MISPPDIYGAAMRPTYNWLHERIFPRFFKKITADVPHREALNKAATTGTIIYIAKQMGQLEYQYYSHLLHSLKLPLAAFANTVTVKRWLPWKELKAMLTTRSLPDPVASGYARDLVMNGKSILISLTPSALDDDALFLFQSKQILTEILSVNTSGKQPIIIVPLEFVWDARPPKAQKSFFDILFGEKENPGPIRKTVLFWRNYKRRAIARIGAPLPLSDIISKSGNVSLEEQVLALRRTLMDALTIERRTATGPPIRPRSWFLETLLTDRLLEKELHALSLELQQNPSDVWNLAERYAKEIVADLDYTFIELANRILGWFFRTFFDELVVDSKDIAALRELAATRAVILAPNHKSHVDYLFLSYALYSQRMTVPYIAGGKNLSFWPLGPIFRRGGAYFIRRSFRGNRIYRAVLKTYLRILLHEGYAQEFFIEGGRSRSGKLGLPRMGLLSLLEEAAREGSIANVTFVPVAISYERVVEQKGYMEELKGKEKRTERTSDILKLTQYVRGKKKRYGNIYLRLGTPLRIEDAPASPEKISFLASHICYEINRNIVATPRALVALALLSFRTPGITHDAIMRRTTTAMTYLRTKGASLSPLLTHNPEKAVQEALLQFAEARLILPHHQERIPFYEVEDSKRLDLDYIKNGVIHFFASIGVISRLILRQSDDVIREETLLEPFSLCKELFTLEFRFSTHVDSKTRIGQIFNTLVHMGALEEEAGIYRRKKKSGDILETFAQCVDNFFDSYRLVFRLIETMEQNTEERSVAAPLKKLAHDMLLLGELQRSEALSRWNIQNAFTTFVTLGVLDVDDPRAIGKRIFSPKREMVKKLQVQLERIF